MTRYPIEAYTTVFDYLKHIASLCTASILLLVAFLEKLFSDPEWKICVAISLISFLCSIVGTMIAQVSTIEMIDHEETVGAWAEPLFFKSFLVVFLAFLIGLISLITFALKNLY